MRRLTVHPSQTQIPAAIHGATNPRAGQRAKTAGMAQAAANTPADWATECDAAIEEMARRGLPFQASDMVREGLITEPDNHHRWGPRFGAAAKHGVIQRVAPGKSNRTTSRSSLLNTWIGTPAYRAGGAA